MAARLVDAFRASDASHLERVRADVERHPSRILANALVNSAWRNGPVENIHAGGFRGYPLDQRRMTPAEEGELMGFTSERLAFGMTVCLQLATERPRRPWTEQMLPYGLAELMMITPSGWTLTEATREVRLLIVLDPCAPPPGPRAALRKAHPTPALSSVARTSPAGIVAPPRLP